ncbi:hypothetical protein [Halorussus halobius]|uniref:hypothetical protein n=1 Tax=Halorussus halobius TaxID=1710537 RepID=UPI00143CCA0A|nr:hypothetical protein [Halorussus halobius]
MTDASRKLAALYAVTVLVGGTLAGATVGGLTAAGATAGNQGVALSCVDSSGGGAYVAASGLTVYENAADVHYATFDDGGGTVTLHRAGNAGTVALSAAGNAAARVDVATDARTCLGNVDGGDAPVTVDPVGTPAIVVESDVSKLAYRDPVYDPSDDGADVALDATGRVTLSVASTGLDDGTTVVADTPSGVELARKSVPADGSVELTVSAGTYRIDLHTASTPSTTTPDAGPSQPSSGGSNAASAASSTTAPSESTRTAASTVTSPSTETASGATTSGSDAPSTVAATATSADSATATRATSALSSPTPSPESGVPGFGPLVTGLALAALVLATARRGR